VAPLSSYLPCLVKLKGVWQAVRQIMGKELLQAGQPPALYLWTHSPASCHLPQTASDALDSGQLHTFSACATGPTDPVEYAFARQLGIV